MGLRRLFSSLRLGIAWRGVTTIHWPQRRFRYSPGLSESVLSTARVAAFFSWKHVLVLGAMDDCSGACKIMYVEVPAYRRGDVA